MTRRGAGRIVVAVIVVALVGAGIGKRQQLMDERDAARDARAQALAHFVATAATLDDTVQQAIAIETANLELRRETDDLRAVADGVAAQVGAITEERDNAVLAAYAANGEVGSLRACLDGINRALNQVSVGDPGSVRTLDSVRTSCRAVS